MKFFALQLSIFQLNRFREHIKGYVHLSNLPNQLIHTVLYRVIYRCIVILRGHYIDTCKSCIVASLMHIHFRPLSITCIATKLYNYIFRMNNNSKDR